MTAKKNEEETEHEELTPEQIVELRTTGSEKSAEVCPTCGGDVPTVTTEYGSVVRGACPKCNPDQLKAQKAAARKGGK